MLSKNLHQSVPFAQNELCLVERCGAVVKRRTRDREVPGSIPTNCKCCFLEQETLSTLLSTGFYPGKKRAAWKISTRLLNVLPSINKVDYYYYYYLVGEWIEIKFKVETKSKMAAIANFVG